MDLGAGGRGIAGGSNTIDRVGQGEFPRIQGSPHRRELTLPRVMRASKPLGEGGNQGARRGKETGRGTEVGGSGVFVHGRDLAPSLGVCHLLCRQPATIASG
jgi:hypothetical protein